MSNNDNFLRNTDGFFASVTPRQDAVEAVSVTLSAAGAQVGGGAGAVTMAFQTRSGGNRFTGSAYEYYRNPDFNTNYVFNEINHQPKNEVKLNTFGARVGGPIVIPGLYDGHNKAFFFVHYEQIRFPNSFTRTRTVFNPRVYDGWFRYQFGNDVREVNLLQLAAANGQISATDPTMMKLLGQIDASTKTTGTRAAQSDPLYDNYVWQSPSELFEHQPTVRLDYNLTDNHRLNGSFSQITAKRTPDYLNNTDPRFPGAPNQRDFVSTRPLIALALRSVLSQEHRQRAARRVDRLRERLEFRLRLEHHLAQRSQHVRRLRRLRDQHAEQHDHQLVHVQRPELAQGADLQRGGHADLEPGRAHHHDRRQLHHLERLVLGPDHGSRDHAGVQHGLRSRRPACSTPPTSLARRAIS